MDYAKIVSMFQCRTHLNGNIDDSFPAYFFLSAKLLLDIFAIHILHRVEQHSLLFAEPNELNDIGML